MSCWKVESTRILLMSTSALWTGKKLTRCVRDGLMNHLDNGEEVGAVAGELEGAPLRVSPLLAPTVLHHRVLVLPFRVGSEKLPRQPGG